MTKKLVLAFAALSLLATWVSSALTQDAFERGFEQGYQAEIPNSITPIPPIPPIPELGQTDFQAGIAAGAKQGLEDSGKTITEDNDDD